MACISTSGSLLLLHDLHHHSLPSFSGKNSPALHTRSATGSKGQMSIRCLKSTARDLRPQLDEYPEGIISGEWTENFSFLSYDDLRAYFESQPIINKMNPSAHLGEIMSVATRTATPEQRLEEIDHHFQTISGLPVLDAQRRCVGVVSKKDMERASLGSRTMVGEVMSSPAITLSHEKTVLDAAALMLKMKIHRIPMYSKHWGSRMYRSIDWIIDSFNSSIVNIF